VRGGLHDGAVSAWTRLRPALAELALAFGGLLFGLGVLILGGVLGLTRLDGGAERLLRFVWGPVMTAVGALFYRWASRALRDADERVKTASTPDGDVVRGVPKQLGVVTAAIVAALAGSYVLGQLMALLGFPVEEQQAILDIVASAKARGAYVELVILGISACVLAPLAEEWMFRGLLFRRLLEVSGRPEAYVLSSVAFAAIHTNPAGFVIYTWLGVCFAVTLSKTGRLWTAMAVHAGNNAFAYGLLLVV
jgi:membrane protease YdiL (CAAX protease family)